MLPTISEILLIQCFCEISSQFFVIIFIVILFISFPEWHNSHESCFQSLIIHPVTVTIQELHFLNMTFFLIKARFVLSNDTMTHLPPFKQILPPSHILHMYSLINPQEGQLGSGQYKTVFKLEIISWLQLCFSPRPMKAEWPYWPYPCETRQNDAKVYQDL